MKNLRLYQTDGDYTSDPITREYPTVSYCKETDTVHIEKRPSYFIGTYNVTSTTRTTILLGDYFDLSQIKEMYIDDVKQETVVSNYTFTTTGNHTVKCVMMDNVTDMSDMFSSCYSLTSIDVSNFNTSNVTNMTSMFEDCSGLTSLDLSSFNTSNVTDMSGMFNACNSLTSIDVSNFNTSNVTNMSQMFYKCSGLTSLDVSNFDTSNVTYMGYMFSKCSGLTSVTFGSQANVSKVTSYSLMFGGITTTGTLYYPSAYTDAWNNIIVTNQSSSMFPTTWSAVAVDYENE